MSQIAKYLLGALAALFIVAWQGAALATSLDGSAGQPVSVVVKYADLDLNRPADVRLLYRRIRLAADRSCGERVLTGSHLALTSWQQCVAAAVDAAVLQVDRPALTAYHHEHTAEAARRG